MKKFLVYILYLILGFSVNIGDVRAENNSPVAQNRAIQIQDLKENNNKSNGYKSLEEHLTTSDRTAEKLSPTAEKIEKADSLQGENTTYKRIESQKADEAETLAYHTKKADLNGQKSDGVAMQNTTAEREGQNEPKAEKSTVSQRGADGTLKDTFKQSDNLVNTNSYDADKTMATDASSDPQKIKKNEDRKLTHAVVDKSEYIIRYIDVSEPDDTRQTKKFSEQIGEFFMLPLVFDRAFPDAEIDKNLEPTLQALYPDMKAETVSRYLIFIRTAVKYLRKYRAIVAKLKHEVKSNLVMPKDTPIVAKDGEFAEEFTTADKKSPAGKYQVSYKPYKYLEYDSGKLGEPVRRRDKNYESSEDLPFDEMMLALYDFDFKRLYKAWKKMPFFEDGSDEKPMLTKGGVYARLILDTARPGDKKKIYGAIELQLPKDHYIIGDFLTKGTAPDFELIEGKNGTQNISSFKLSQPIANAVMKDGRIVRMFNGIVYLPFEFERTETNKVTVISGKSGYYLCDKNHHCRTETVEHWLRLKPSETVQDSVFQNAVTQAFAHLPTERTRHAVLKRAEFEKHKLTLRFETDKHFNNVAVMAEDAEGTNFINPRYKLGKNFAEVTFEADGGDVGTEIAVSARFDNEQMRKIVSMQTPLKFNPYATAFGGKALLTAILWGLMLNFMPVGFYLCGRSWRLFKERKVFWAYSCGVILGLATCVGFYELTDYKVHLVSQPIFLAFGLITVLALMTECAEYMDFALFRPFKKILPCGLFYGFGLTVIGLMLPYWFKDEVLFTLDNGTAMVKGLVGLGMVGGIIMVPWGLKFWRDGKNLETYWLMFKRFNLFYCGLALLWLMWGVWCTNGGWLLAVWLITAVILWAMWFGYPMALTAAVDYLTDNMQKRAVYMRIQNHFAKLLVIISLIFTGVLGWGGTPQGKNSVSFIDGQKILTSRLTAHKPTMILVEDNLTFLTLKNRIVRLKMENNFDEVLVLNSADSETELWMKQYRMNPKIYYLPQTMVISPKYPNGLLLPQDLKQTDFRKISAVQM